MGGISLATAVRPWTAHRDEFKSPEGAASRLSFNCRITVIRPSGSRIVLDELASACFWKQRLTVLKILCAMIC